MADLKESQQLLGSQRSGLREGELGLRMAGDGSSIGRFLPAGADS